MENTIQHSTSEYFSKPAISNSALKDWKVMAPHQWKAMWIDKTVKRKAKATTKLGSLVDCLMFTPQDLDKRFIVSTITPPSAKVQLILNDAVDHVNELNENAAKINADNKKNKTGVAVIPKKEHTLDNKELIVALCNTHDHYRGKPDQGYNDVIKKGAEYFEFLITTQGKDVISQTENIIALSMKESLLNDKTTRGFFTPKKNCEVIFQNQIFNEFELSGFENIQFLPTKGAQDIIHFNHKMRQVREVDLKCTEDVFLWKEQVRRMDYGQQHSFYDYLIKEWLKTYKNGEYADYTVGNPLNIVIDESKIPYIYTFYQEDLHVKRFGIEGTPIRGWEDDLNDIAFHMDCQDWSRPKEHIKNGFMSVRLFNKR